MGDSIHLTLRQWSRVSRGILTFLDHAGDWFEAKLGVAQFLPILIGKVTIVPVVPVGVSRTFLSGNPGNPKFRDEFSRKRSQRPQKQRFGELSNNKVTHPPGGVFFRTFVFVFLAFFRGKSFSSLGSPVGREGELEAGDHGPANLAIGRSAENLWVDWKSVRFMTIEVVHEANQPPTNFNESGDTTPCSDQTETVEVRLGMKNT